jgi:hypothetical protein
MFTLEYGKQMPILSTPLCCIFFKVKIIGRFDEIVQLTNIRLHVPDEPDSFLPCFANVGNYLINLELLMIKIITVYKMHISLADSLGYFLFQQTKFFLNS